MFEILALFYQRLDITVIKELIWLKDVDVADLFLLMLDEFDVSIFSFK